MHKKHIFLERRFARLELKLSLYKRDGIIFLSEDSKQGYAEVDYPISSFVNAKLTTVGMTGVRGRTSGFYKLNDYEDSAGLLMK